MNTNDTTKQRILLAAGPIFAKKGFRSATVREICDAASVNLASINYYFGDKQRLYIETVVCARNMRAQQVPAPTWSISTPPQQKFRDFVSMLLQRMMALQSAPWHVRLLMREILQPTEACRKLVEDYFRPTLEQLMTIIDELSSTSLSESQRFQMAFSVIGQCMYYRFAWDVAMMMIEGQDLDSDFDLAHLTDHIYTFSMTGIEGLVNSTVDHTTDSCPSRLGH